MEQSLPPAQPQCFREGAISMRSLGHNQGKEIQLPQATLGISKEKAATVAFFLPVLARQGLCSLTFTSHCEVYLLKTMLEGERLYAELI